MATPIRVPFDGANITAGVEEIWLEGTDEAGFQLAETTATLDEFTGDNDDPPNATIWSTAMAGSGTLNIQDNTLQMVTDTTSWGNYAVCQVGQQPVVGISDCIYVRWKVSGLSVQTVSIGIDAVNTTTGSPQFQNSILIALGDVRLGAGGQYTITPHDVVADTWYTYRFRKIAEGRVWQTSITGGAFGSSWTVLGSCARQVREITEYTAAYVYLQCNEAGVTTNFDYVRTGPAYSADAETVEFLAVPFTKTVDWSTFRGVAVNNDDESVYAADATEVKYAYKVDSGAWTSWLTMEDLRLEIDSTPSSSFQIKAQLDGDGSEQIRLCNVYVSGSSIEPTSLTALDLDNATFTASECEETFGEDGTAIQQKPQDTIYDDFSGNLDKWTTDNASISSGELLIQPGAASYDGYAYTTAEMLAEPARVSCKFKLESIAADSRMIIGIRGGSAASSINLGIGIVTNGSDVFFRAANRQGTRSLATVAADTWYTVIFEYTGDNGIWNIYLDGNGFDDEWITSLNLTDDDIYLGMWCYGNHNFYFDDVKSWLYGSAYEVELSSIVGEATYYRSSLKFQGLSGFPEAALVASSDVLKFADDVDGAGYGSWYDLTAFRALENAEASTSYQIKTQLNSAGRDRVKILRGQIETNVTGGGVAPGQATVTATFNTTAGSFDYTYTAGSGTVTDDYLAYRKWGTATWTKTSASGSGTISSLDSAVYQVTGYSENNGVAGDWAAPVLVWAGANKIKGTLEEIRAILQSGLSYVGDRQVIITPKSKYLVDRFPCVAIKLGAGSLKFGTDLTENEMTVDIQVSDKAFSSAPGAGATMESALIGTERDGELGLPYLWESVAALLKNQKPSTCQNVVIPSNVSAPQPVGTQSQAMWMMQGSFRFILQQ